MERVLLVDDEPQVLVALEDLLTDEFIVLKTESPEQALELVNRDNEIAVVISDERMPRMPGGELFAKIRDTSNARRILVTGFADLSAVIRAVNDGRIFAFVKKPWDGIDLKSKVHQAAEQFRLVQEVTSEHQLLHDLMDNTPDGIFFKDRQRKIRGANGSFAALLGAEDESAFIGKTIEEINPTLAHIDASRAEEEAILSSGRPTLDVVREYSRQGQKRWISETKAPIWGPQNRVLGLVGIARDVTDRVHMQETLRESEQQLSQQTRLLNSILNSMREAVIASDRTGQFTLFNRQAQAMFGSPGGDSALDWARAQEVCLPDEPYSLQPDQNPLVRAVRGEHTNETEVNIKSASPSGAILTVTGTPLKNEFNELVGGLALLKDVSEQRVLERQLAQAQKMEAIGRLAGGVAHDFNNLLSVIVGYADFIQSRLPDDASMREDIGEVLKAANRAAGLTRQLLSISRQTVVRQQTLQLNDVVSNLEKMLQRVIGEDIELATDLSPSQPPVKADLGQLEQLILNLTVNARDAMPKGGKLTFHTGEIELRESLPLAFGQVPPGSYAILAVSDTGIGMNKETLKRIFEPFFTTKAVGKGTGLGLATVYGIVKQSRGQIDVQSEPEQGACFTIYLPKTDAQAQTYKPRQSSSAPRPTLQTSTVLLVEDDDSVRLVSSRILRAQGHSVLEAKSPSEALHVCQDHGANIDLLLTDVVLPEMSGTDLAKRLSGLCRNMKVLYMSGYPGTGVLDEQLVDGEVAYMQKPFSPYSLAEKVRELLELKS